MVLVPSLPGCITFGTTIEDALAMAEEAIALHFEGLAAESEPIPEDEGAPVLATFEVWPGRPASRARSPGNSID